VEPSFITAIAYELNLKFHLVGHYWQVASRAWGTNARTAPDAVSRLNRKYSFSDSRYNLRTKRPLIGHLASSCEGRKKPNAKG
jgi:hypothetical protein